jgi:hypothetical protein
LAEKAKKEERTVMREAQCGKDTPDGCFFVVVVSRVGQSQLETLPRRPQSVAKTKMRERLVGA